MRQEKLKKMIEERAKVEAENRRLGNKGGTSMVTGLNKSLSVKELMRIEELNANPFAYLEIKGGNQKGPPNDGRNLRVTLEIITKMNYKDFN